MYVTTGDEHNFIRSVINFHILVAAILKDNKWILYDIGRKFDQWLWVAYFFQDNAINYCFNEPNQWEFMQVGPLPSPIMSLHNNLVYREVITRTQTTHVIRIVVCDIAYLSPRVAATAKKACRLIIVIIIATCPELVDDGPLPSSFRRRYSLITERKGGLVEISAKQIND